MSNVILRSIIVSMLIIASSAINAQDNTTSVIGSSSSEQLSKLRGSGMAFTQNKGQVIDMQQRFRPDILYKGAGGGADIYLRKTGVSYVYSDMQKAGHEADEQIEDLIKAGVIKAEAKPEKKSELMQKRKINLHRVDMDFANCNKSSEIDNEDEVEGYQNFYYAHCPEGITNVKQYNKVTYKNMYKGIDVSYYGDKQNGVKYDIIVKPHADPDQIKLHWNGAEDIKILNDRLVIKTSVNEFYESIPKVYQNINGRIVDVKTKYVLTAIDKGEAIINFSFLIYNSSFPLIIDPWVTYYGGSNFEQGYDIATDNSGNCAVTGQTYSTGFPVFAGHQMAQGGGLTDGFVLKFDAWGNRLWATYYGGSGSNDIIQAVRINNSEDIVVVGSTDSPNIPVLAGGGYSQTYGGGGDVIIVKFNAAGIRLWATYYGGNNVDSGQDIALDNVGNIVITGITRSSNFPVLAGSQMVSGGLNDAFIVKFNTTGILQWASYYGGSSLDYGFGIATDNTGNIFVTGWTFSINFPVLIGFQMASGGSDDAFVLKFTSTGTILWATYYGGSASDRGTDIAIDNVGNIIVVGMTSSPSFPVLLGFQTVAGGLNDAFIVKFNTTGAPQWATYLGGNAPEWGYGVTIDVNNNIYVLGEWEETDQGDYTISTCAYQPVYGGGVNGEDQFIAKYTPTGLQTCITFLGGLSEDDKESNGGIAASGNFIYITARSGGSYPVTTGAFQAVSGGAEDAIIAQLCINLCEAKALGLSYTTNTTSVCENVPIKFTPSVANSCDTTGYKFHWVFAGGNPAVSDSVNPTVSFAGVSTHDVKLVVTTLCKKDSLTKTNYITTTQCNVCTLAGQFTKGTAACAACGCKEWVLVNATGGTQPYTYQWPDGYDKRYKNKICPGNYTIKVTDKNGCSVDVVVSVP